MFPTIFLAVDARELPKNVNQERSTKVSIKNVPQEWRARVFHKSVNKQECSAPGPPSKNNGRRSVDVLHTYPAILDVDSAHLEPTMLKARIVDFCALSIYQ